MSDFYTISCVIARELIVGKTDTNEAIKEVIKYSDRWDELKVWMKANSLDAGEIKEYLFLRYGGE